MEASVADGGGWEESVGEEPRAVDWGPQGLTGQRWTLACAEWDGDPWEEEGHRTNVTRLVFSKGHLCWKQGDQVGAIAVS